MIRARCATRSNGKVTKRNPNERGKQKTISCWSLQFSLHIRPSTQSFVYRCARNILESYWERLGGKPTSTSSKPASKKRIRQSTGGSGTPDSTAVKKQRKSTGDSRTPDSTVVKKQRKTGSRKSKDTSAKDDEKTAEPPAGFTDVGNDNWKAPKPTSSAWDPLVQTVDTIEKDDQGELWAYLIWNDKNEDGRFYRSKARLMTCNKACPQRV